ncbi:S1C family serine protease [Rathayibacter iranicus]|uniref:PDZ domain-containing protein n=2 Tax=Rathayibacter iranicus TaxID=59737 RepID=A0AAD1AEI7_9MICO|nr:trypsin-like peptidase domain-containing protein [Rathayibacter iranicus]AZZ56764.1 PDZ domain-containing protein [Rathayibacter iranicus]MWV31189.1 trypsin-like serine protease [Rathayibacter iranicus NCPPB 2253 = VKM Ac-1602]PPI58355.1 septum formation initiator [Rathayibacter iranicus]PWJ63534.1 S1-C subfamily serine protease [Rathayibacter iranicus NCPPB 2253 = VKM Ac-1602]
MNERHEPNESEFTDPIAAQADAATERQALRADDRRRRRRALIAGGAGLAVLIGVAAGGVSYAGRVEAAASASSSTTATVDPGRSRGVITISPFPNGSISSGGSAAGGYGSSTATDAVPASTSQTAGVVTITSDLAYQNARSAGTGVILTSDGMILTNNHVVAGATAVTVTVESSGHTYSARVVGTDATHDVAVLQLENASGLTPARLDTDGVAVGDAVAAVGNAGGTGDLVVAAGSVTALNQQITTSSEAGVSGETLTGLIQTDADIVSGDSGGPLVDSTGRVVGINTAASSGTADITGFAIPISTALDVVAAIEAGADTATVRIGYPAFLGVSLSSSASVRPGGRGVSSTSGALIAGVVEKGPAAAAGLAAGDTVTAVDGTAIASADALSTTLAAREPGESVVVSWIDASGAAYSAPVVLAEGPVA